MFKATSLRDLFEDKYRPLAMLGCSRRSFAEHRTTINRWRTFLGRDPLVSELEDERVALFLEWVAAVRSPATVEKQMASRKNRSRQHGRTLSEEAQRIRTRQGISSAGDREVDGTEPVGAAGSVL